MRGKASQPAKPPLKGVGARANASRRGGAGQKRSAGLSESAVPLPEALAVELYTLVRLALGQLGVTEGAQRRAMERSRSLTQAPHVSGPLLRDTRGLCGLLLEWSREEEFLDAQGKPRILAIKGQGATFQTLAARFLPQVPLDRVVDMACATAEVATRPGGKIALLGGVLVNVVKSRNHLLAHAIRQIDQLLETILHNAGVHKKGRGTGRLERMVLGVISREQFNDLSTELQPQIDDLLQRVDSAMQARQPKSRRSLTGATAVSVSVYVSQEEDWARAGIDASPLVSAARRRPIK